MAQTTPGPLPPWTPGEGVLQGRIVHPDPANAVLGGLVVTITALEQGRPWNTWKVDSADDGSFRFEALNTDPGIKYGLETIYQGATYRHLTGPFPSDLGPLAAEFEVFDSAPSPSGLTIDGMHIILDAHPGANVARVTEMIFMSNPSGKTLIGRDQDRLTLSLDLPPGFSNLQVDDGLDESHIGVDENQMFYYGAIYPGKTQVMISYLLPPQSVWMFRRRLTLPMSSLDVFVKQGGPAILSPQLAQAEPLIIQGSTFQRYRGGPFDAGTSIFFQVGGSELNATSSKTGEGSILVVLAMGLGLLGFVLWPLLRRLSSEPDAARSTPDARTSHRSRLRQEQARLLLVVKELDLDFESGKLSEADYHQLRDEHKQKAIDVMLELDALETTKTATGDGSPAPSPETPASKKQARGDADAPERPARTQSRGDRSQSASSTARDSKDDRGLETPPEGQVTFSRNFCTKCGARARPDDHFCGHCGSEMA